MLFNSYEFLFYFLPVVLAGYYALPFRARSIWLTAASYAFYGWWRVSFCFLMLASTCVDYYAGKRIHATESPAKRRLYLLLSVLANLGLLGFFKYWDFAAETVNAVTGGAAGVPILKITLPIGISFYTFQSMSYSIDVYRRRTEPAERFIDFAQYVSLFPQLVAGPIVRYRTLADQIRWRDHTADKASLGVRLIALGLSKKVLLADSFAVFSDAYFLQPEPGLVNSWVGVYSYSLQVYFDFSGYSDLALGLGALLGFRFPVNFSSPYKSTNISELWRRWHVTLGAWLRDYVYMPLELGTRRRTELKTGLYLTFTMVLCGAWHGAKWTFVVFGLYHGIAMTLHRLWSRRGKVQLPAPAARAITFAFWLSSLAFFRSDDMTDAWTVFGSLVGLHGAGSLSTLPAAADLVMLVVGGVLVWCFPNSNEWENRLGPMKTLALAVLFLLSVGAVLVNDETPFLYYQF